jgi:hypothetical protein
MTPGTHPPDDMAALLRALSERAEAAERRAREAEVQAEDTQSNRSLGPRSRGGACYGRVSSAVGGWEPRSIACIEPSLK